MKIKDIVIAVSAVFMLNACNDLNLNPLSEGSTESWYSSETEIQMSINDLYRDPFWPLTQANGGGGDDAWTDDWMYREALTPVTGGTITSEWSVANTKYWLNSYKAIGRCNTILSNLDRLSGKVLDQTITRYEAEVRFVRACQYAKLVFYFGDAVFYTEPMELEEAFSLGRTSKSAILPEIYKDLDFAAEHLPASYSASAIQRATKGAAYAMKARAALCEGDYTTAKTAAKACIDLGVYKLHPDFASLFLTSTKQSDEFVFVLPRSVEFKLTLSIQDVVPRNTSGGWGAWSPTWDLFCAFPCTDGLPIDESPLFDPHNPFRNRDPRCSETFVEFNTPHMGFIYQPHPDSLQALNLSTGKWQTNNDSRGNAQFASFNGMLWKKGVDNTWLLNNWQVDPAKLILRYADVLLMYAEAKIESNDIDESALDAINQVRARAYGVNYTQTDKYPAVTTTNQAQLRTVIRTERRIEFAFEGRRYMDIIRWRIAEKVLNQPNYGMLDPAALREKVVKPGLWFFPETPPIDEDGVADFTAMYNKGLIKKITQRVFDKNRQYLWPIPAKDILINSNLTQNPNY
ncbi:starch-binding protein [Bacteroidia bacterium]|nr:starch-binding protein [Bacteroidia bacterium]